MGVSKQCSGIAVVHSCTQRIFSGLNCFLSSVYRCYNGRKEKNRQQRNTFNFSQSSCWRKNLSADRKERQICEVHDLSLLSYLSILSTRSPLVPNAAWLVNRSLRTRDDLCFQRSYSGLNDYSTLIIQPFWGRVFIIL